MAATATAATRRWPGADAVVVGAGGAIGSAAVGLLARLLLSLGLARVTLIDRDVYEPRNLAGQNIVAADVGKPKVTVQARALRRIDPRFEVVAVHDDVANVPLGIFRAGAVLGCLDSKLARLITAQAAWSVGAPYVDAGILTAGLMARVSVGVPAAGESCLVCGWDADSVDSLPQAYPCDLDRAEAQPHPPAPTNAPASLAALAAALQATEVEKLLRGQLEHSLRGRQVVISALTHTHFVTRIPENPHCRCNHAVWQIEAQPLPADLSIREALTRTANGTATGAVSLRVPRRHFVRALTCPQCGKRSELFRLAGRLRRRERTCAGCGRDKIAIAFDTTERLRSGELPDAVLERSLHSTGLCAGDVVAIESNDSQRYFEIAPGGPGSVNGDGNGQDS